ncbi:MAG: putative bifunctional diguanylate cyclase/phosphodiesterase [Hyphomonadaceae bacterium]
MGLVDLKTTFLGEVDVPAGHRDAINAARRRRFHSLAPLAAIYSLLNAVVLTSAFWGHAGMPMVFVWCYTSAVLIFIRTREAQRPAGQFDQNVEDGRIVRYTLLSGALWSGMIAVIIASSGAEHALLLGVFTAAILCVGALLHSSFPIASLGYSLLIAAGAGLGMMLAGHPWSLNAVLLLAAGVIALQRFAAADHVSDIRRHLATAAMQEAKDTAALLLQDFEAQSSDWMWRIDAQGRLGSPSQRFVDASGLAHHDLDGGSFLALFAPESVHHLQELLKHRTPFRGEALRVTIGSRDVWWSLSGQPTADGGWRGVCSDITRSRDAEARIAYVTEYDTLTDLPNRAALVRELEIAKEAACASDESFALFVIDLDNFKALNETQGHPVGDAYLRVMAERLRDCVGQTAFLARLGGDEFAVLHRDMLADEAGAVAELIVDALLAPVTLNGREILAGGSVGVALAPENGSDPAILMKNAELALYRAKAQGRGCARFFEAGMEENARVRADLETDLRSALASEAMDVYFQPLVNTRTRQVAGYETLLRWNRPGHGLVSPAVFISCAEETGIIVPLGEWVIRKAIEEAAQWRDDVTVAVNLSAAQMHEPSLVATVVGALAASQLDPSRLEIEIVESVLMDETQDTIRTLHALRELGVKIALDDFGTGYSSLSYLRAFPFDKIKIDQRFVRDIDTSVENRAIVRAVISLARDLGMRVTAEGVENDQQAAILTGLGCTEVQGFLYSRPIPASEIEKVEADTRPASNMLKLRRKA